MKMPRFRLVVEPFRMISVVAMVCGLPVVAGSQWRKLPGVTIRIYSKAQLTRAEHLHFTIYDGTSENILQFLGYLAGTVKNLLYSIYVSNHCF